MSAVTPAAEMTAAMAAAVAPAEVTTTVASSVTTAAMATATMATTAVPTTTCLGRHVGCGHYQTASSDSREAIDSGQGPKGQELAQSLVRHASSVRLTHFSSPFVLFNDPK
jgi:hypothetical protein